MKKIILSLLSKYLPWVVYCILGIVRGIKLSRITFIDVVNKKTFTGSQILRSSDNQLHKICDLVLANPELRRLRYSSTDRYWPMLWLAHTHWASLPPWLPLHLASHVLTVFSVFLPPQIITEQVICSRKTIPLASSLAAFRPFLIISCLVAYHHWINCRNSLRNIFVILLSDAW